MPSKIVLHIPPQTYAGDDLTAQHLALHARIRRLVVGRGGRVEIRQSDTRLRRLGGDDSDKSDLLEDDALHILENGTVQRSNVLNTSMCYLPGYFQLDPKGVLAFSSAGDAVYDPVNQPGGPAQHLIGHLRKTLVATRQSRYDQPQDVTALPTGAIAVFLQGRNPERQGSAYCDTETMLRAVVAGAGGRPVVVKAHPKSDTAREADLLYRMMSEGLNLHPTDANVHDMLAACAVTVSFNSAVAIEGFLHDKPAILFGRSDFHHMCETVTAPQDFADALARALRSRCDYARFLQWFLCEQHLPLDDPDLDARILARFTQAGFSPDRLGLADVSDPATAPAAAANVLTRFLRAQPQIQSATILQKLKVTPVSWVLVARINGEKVVVKRFLDGNPPHTVNSLRDELAYMTDVLGDGPYQVNRCLMAWPDAGTVVLTYAQGPRLGDKIAGASGQQRDKLLEASGAWLAAYTAPRQRATTFGPRFWIRRLLAQDRACVTDDRDKALLDAMIEALRRQVPEVMGCPVLQGATHGDFVGINAHFHRGVITGVDIQGEVWLAIAREAARFLVWLQIHDPDRPADRRFGIAAADWQAFARSGVLPAEELTTTLPFFVGEQLYARFVESYDRSDVAPNTRAAIIAYLEATS